MLHWLVILSRDLVFTSQALGLGGAVRLTLHWPGCWGSELQSSHLLQWLLDTINHLPDPSVYFLFKRIHCYLEQRCISLGKEGRKTWCGLLAVCSTLTHEFAQINTGSCTKVLGVLARHDSDGQKNCASFQASPSATTNTDMWGSVLPALHPGTKTLSVPGMIRNEWGLILLPPSIQIKTQAT